MAFALQMSVFGGKADIDVQKKRAPLDGLLGAKKATSHLVS
jgi:hypothetical protein